MAIDLIVISVISACVFGGLVLMSDRRRGAALAQAASVVAAAAIFAALVREAPVFGLAQSGLLAFGVTLLAAALAAMGYHLYLGRFASVRTARAVFTLVFLGTAALLRLLT